MRISELDHHRFRWWRVTCLAPILSEPLLTYHGVNPKEQTSMKYEANEIITIQEYYLVILSTKCQRFHSFLNHLIDIVVSTISLFKLWSPFQDLLMSISITVYINTSRPRQNGRHFADDIFNWIFLNEIFWISNDFSLKCVPYDLIHSMSSLVQIIHPS